MREVFLYAYLAGLVGSIFMDVTENYFSKKGISSGVKVNHIGRWFLGMLKGNFKHKDIDTSAVMNHEIKAGMFFHYVLAGGGIAFLYPILLYITGLGLNVNHIMYATVFGFLTNVFPWFWMMPSFGWGIAGLKKPSKSETVVAPTLSHLMYGLGLGLTLTVFY